MIVVCRVVAESFVPVTLGAAVVVGGVVSAASLITNCTASALLAQSLSVAVIVMLNVQETVGVQEIIQETGLRVNQLGRAPEAIVYAVIASQFVRVTEGAIARLNAVPTVQV